MNIQLSRRTTKHPLNNRDLLMKVLDEAARLSGLADREPAEAGLQLVILGERAMTGLNEGFLGHPGSTDVITFDLRGGVVCPDEPPMIGEIYVCAAVAERAAVRHRTTCSRELILYMVHGMLHLAGLDDLEPAAAREMRRGEKRVMDALAVSFDLDTVFA
jgi:probable rRNA maturation factor